MSRVNLLLIKKERDDLQKRVAVLNDKAEVPVLKKENSALKARVDELAKLTVGTKSEELARALTAARSELKTEQDRVADLAKANKKMEAILIDPNNAIGITTDQVKAIIEEVGAPHLRLQLDLYHLQVTEGDLQKRMERLFPITSHVQIAGNPDRNEPDIGEVNHLYLLDVLDRLGYDGYVGLEYKPRTTTGAGLGWAAKYGIKA